MGTRAAAPPGDSMSTTAPPTPRGAPSPGAPCMPKPGTAFTSTLPPPRHAGGDGVGRADEPAAHHQEAEVETLQVALDDDLLAVLAGLLIGQAQLALALDVREDAPAVGRVQGLHHRRPAQVLRDV